MGQLPQFLPPASRAVDHSRCAVADVSTRPHTSSRRQCCHSFRHPACQFSSFHKFCDRNQDVASVSLLVLKLHTRASSAPTLRIVRQTHPSLPSAPLCSFLLQTTNSSIRSEFSKLAIDQPSTCFQILTNSFSNSFDSSSRFVRLENHAEFGYMTPFDLTP